MDTRPPPTPLSPPAPGGTRPQDAFALPPIRTMADDLRAAQGGGLPPAPPGSAPTPGPLARPAARDTGRSIALPGAPPRRRRPSRFWMVAVLLVVLLAAAGGSVWWLLPSSSGTIADVLPAETLAFVSVSRGELEEKFVTTFTAALDAAPAVLGEEWTELAYIILPGATPSQPVSALVLRGDGAQPQVQGAETLAVKTLPQGAVALVAAEDAGRLDGLTRQPLGRSREFQKLSRGLARSPGLLYVRAGYLPVLLTPFALFPPQAADAVLLTLTPGGAGITVAGARGVGEKVSERSGTWDELLRAVPQAAVAVFGRANVGGDLDAWRTKESGNPALQAFFQALTQAQASVESAKKLLAGPVVGGSLPTATAGVRDGFAVVALSGAAAGDVAGTLRPLEDTLRKLDLFFSGSAFPDAVFEEAAYNGVTIRYVNFGPTRAFDYAVADGFLLVATSRDSMRQLVDALRGSPTGAPTQAGPFPALLQGVASRPWTALRVDPVVLGELPEPWQTVLAPFQALAVFSTGERTLGGAATLN